MTREQKDFAGRIAREFSPVDGTPAKILRRRYPKAELLRLAFRAESVRTGDPSVDLRLGEIARKCREAAGEGRTA